jgi:hypothetical protein
MVNGNVNLRDWIMNTETKPALAYTFRWDYIGFYHVFVIQVENKSNVRLPWFEIHFMRKDSEARVASFWLYCPNRKESFAPCDLAPGDVSIYKTHNITAETLKEGSSD